MSYHENQQTTPKGYVLFMAETEPLDHVSLRVPADTNVFVAVRADDELFIFG